MRPSRRQRGQRLPWARFYGAGPARQSRVSPGGRAGAGLAAPPIGDGARSDRKHRSPSTAYTGQSRSGSSATATHPPSCAITYQVCSDENFT
ncbi:hypothetical protein Veis_2883 [Verminephrobacter eiseniae EF01-2]|uniref:Uncharacterized protein n=1 Tax=Verminephrobacter eiseniae (strain EF01-2) TaxID=391735 RepID=A1WLW2_VEREI|nr:hypothetical protein Veis_2883 [Verminephrobacter eiseniae EF01-2]